MVSNLSDPLTAFYHGQDRLARFQNFTTIPADTRMFLLRVLPEKRVLNQSACRIRIPIPLRKPTSRPPPNSMAKPVSDPTFDPLPDSVSPPKSAWTKGCTTGKRAVR